MERSKFLKIDKPKNGTRWAIPDIHGCAKTFKVLVDSLNLTKEDQLFLLGDYINRGPDNKGVIDFILELKAGNKQVYAIRGNHDEWFLEAWNDFQGLKHLKNEPFVNWVRAEDLVNHKGGLDKVYEDFFESLLYYIQLPDFYLVHAGFEFEDADPFENYEEMIMIRDFEPDLELLEGRKIIHGHSIHHLDDIQSIIDKEGVVIPLDNGCYEGLNYYQMHGYGNLLAFNLDIFELRIEPCLDKKDGQFPTVSRDG